ncbi:EAL domain-containing protein [Nitrobacter sp. JJSN]|uniref:EAL domain-containing protein n=1 Tax=Nitrobacter sp. JJSN TaxID=3453033 RepID=UPI003F760075
MGLHRRFTRIATVVLSAVLFCIAAHVAANALIRAERSRHLRELNDVAMRRSKLAVDFGVAALAELAQRGVTSCDPASLQAVRLQVYQNGFVKDVRIVERDGSVLCSAYSETLEFDNGWASRDEMLPSSDGTALLFRVDQINGVALGLLRDIGEDRALVAIIGLNSSLYDVMPSEIHEGSNVELQLSNGQPIVGYEALHGPLSKDLVDFARSSKQYPLKVSIRVSRAAFARWHDEPYWPIMLTGAVLGFVFGVLLDRAMPRASGEESEFDAALAGKEFRPFYQPIFDISSREIVGCEMLARRIRPDGLIVLPAQFIPIAERTGRMAPMTWQLLGSALQELKPFLRRNKYFKVSINIAPRHLMSEGFVDALRAQVLEARVSARQVVLEVTEREELPDLDAAAAVVAALGEFGFRVAIDDVGIGHSGLSQIQRLGASIIKIDKFFIDRLGADPTAGAVIEMLVRLAAELKMTVIAEGVETPEQAVALSDCGVEQGQGYLVAPPLPFDKFIALLDSSPEQAVEAA